MKLLSDQVTETEINVILRELHGVIERDIAGDVVEFGCYVGTTSVFLAKELQKTSKHLYVYDSFEGLPPKSNEDSSPVGIQFKEGALAASKREFILNFKRAGLPLPHITKAWFNDIPSARLPGHISFAFLDGDYYQSIKDSLALITPLLSPGATIIVDDYANEALPGASAAVDEWLRANTAALMVEASLAIIKTAH